MLPAGSLALPLFLWRVPAGFPSPADDYFEGELDLNDLLIENPAATFYVRLAGDSHRSNGELLIKPSWKSVKSLLARAKSIIHEHRSGTAHLLITRLTPVIRGWANYHRHVVSKRIFAQVDAAIFRMLWRWACSRHPRKGRRWIKSKYFERVVNRDWWFFGQSPDKEESKFAHVRLFHATSVRIVRHVQVKSDVNPYDPRWTAYLAQRSRRSAPAVSRFEAFAKA